ncbi:hypothetical protein LEM8419_01776 [Neolewinella maritima]|uniref:N-acetyltransferase domain-containing protein n=1 Tax=Neolewinella maritima TaxID=1383882 RepID=A0ABM9B0L4_9BACT|nr:GNAT family N-acetyltransferase [Neolewinella maritima]CAH1000642.1 hypothetical protein LEM8419_01776 [Neolewinella maritima]
MVGAAPRIVRATPADLPAIERIARLTWPETFKGILSTDQIAYMLDRMYRPAALTAQLAQGHVFDLLLDADRTTDDYSGQTGMRYRPVGYVSHELDYAPGITKIHKLYLLPGAQGQGFGRLLIDHVARAARRAGQQHLRLDVNYQNSAVDFYSYLGFAKIGRFDTDIGEGYLMEDWRMERPL